ncbi:hypothetical protein SAMN02745824_2739 [Parasphingorhabdus marina DSM 22363]|uniref:Tetratricopeptide repeat-containing protein n=1 Tax=Parasphingorhabdus marina DSM 22363 TaxID=1123272 RepID=A0A1N6GA43_9SPHN|nr:hypothetical protein [Parasphingorhabdus marina]SIO04347.1 hypothetical protein SAMN02745824_2739 [Parasphingorhabdus marina DSM 22363]
MQRKMLVGFGAMLFATAAHAGIPVTNDVECPVGGENFQTVGTASCSNFGGSQDFLLKVSTSCDFVTRLPQCPGNRLPMYKKFSDDEIKRLESYLQSREFQSFSSRSRYFIAKKVDDFLVSGGSEKVVSIYFLLGGLQHDRGNTLSDPEYLAFLDSFDAASLAERSKDDLPYIRLVIAYTHFVRKSYDEAQKLLDLVKSSVPERENKFLTTYITRLESCMAETGETSCRSTEQVMPRKKTD